ncbi:Bug family tripartite tricarboxylate transporter substrate binding protein [Variovorax terrae]|uniref:Tripartite tricarboxylate transporter substrate binding protein n=1 Tax=Variovorax terrae TaxID=2923278 RepID=A0A9X1VW64_9BURK|nr:tripartite tricarboxylate transporter substrate binding protein [Variovorax terrae]MCJ0764379.1 tripartite tricarboxylate transporter substrate binding protein [Variovorax terrae]
MISRLTFLRRQLPALCAGLALALGAATAHAQDAASFPNKPLRLVVPFAAGGGIDLLARITALKMGEILGQTVVVDNQGGGGGVVASRAVARAPADGYTLVFHSVSSAVVNAQVYSNLGYDPVAGFAPVSLVAQFPLVMIVNPAVPARDMKEFIGLLKAHPGKFSYGSSGVGSGIHLAGELFRTLAGVDIQHIPYKGTSAALTDLLGGRIEMLIDGVPPQVGNIAQGRVRPLAVTTRTRSAVLPNVPTMAEAGVPGYDIPFWVAIYAPAGTPRPVVEKLSAAVSKAVKDPATLARFKEAGTEGIGSTPEQLDAFWKEQLATYGKIARQANIKLDSQ